jgi:hypothetical protein
MAPLSVSRPDNFLTWINSRPTAPFGQFAPRRRMARRKQRETLMRKKIALLAAAAGALGFVSVAQAGSLGKPCTNAAPEKWLSIAELQSKAEAQGYTVEKAKLKKACGEIYARDKAGGRVELFLDPTNGEIVGRL